MATTNIVKNVLFLSMIIIGASLAYGDDTWLDVSSSKARAVEIACTTTLYPEKCKASLWNHQALSETPSPMDIMNALLNVSIEAAHRAYGRTKNFDKIPNLDRRNHGALDDCLELLQDTLDELYETLKDLHSATFMTIPKHSDDLRTLLSAAITNQFTCLDGFSHAMGSYRQRLLSRLTNVTHFVSNSLAMVTNMSTEATNIIMAHNKNKKRYEFMRTPQGFPTWISGKDRKLLQASSVRANAVVAKDGSGKFTRIADAVNAAPDKSNSLFVIYIKAGVYAENLNITKKKTNLMFIGDGMGKTVITGNRNVKDGYTTFRSATVAVTGKGFLARDLTIENTAGAIKHQAVALRSRADLSAFYRCSFKGYQDTLYAHSLRQFYRECDIYGTVDFIFGNAAVVFQKCNLLARRPMVNQKIIFTAQGRQDPNENTGISIQDCKVTAAPDLVPVRNSFEAYLGRPWKLYSRTVFMQSYLDDLIQPRGWLEWNGNYALNTLYYGEYMKKGPRAETSARVTWPGFRVIKSPQEASRFTVSKFIAGNAWLPSSGFAFTPGLN